MMTTWANANNHVIYHLISILSIALSCIFHNNQKAFVQKHIAIYLQVELPNMWFLSLWWKSTLQRLQLYTGILSLSDCREMQFIPISSSDSSLLIFCRGEVHFLRGLSCTIMISCYNSIKYSRKEGGQWLCDYTIYGYKSYIYHLIWYNQNVTEYILFASVVDPLDQLSIFFSSYIIEIIYSLYTLNCTLYTMKLY